MKEKKAVKEAFTDLAPRYERTVDDELNTFWGWSYEDFVDRLIQQTPIKAKDKILDIATGTGAIPREIVSKQMSPGIHIIGLDITETMLIHGKSNIPPDQYGSTIGLTCGDAMILPFKRNSFDVVITGLSTHHMNIPRVLSEVERVLKPEGYFSIIDVGTSIIWKLPLIRFLARIIAFFYFLFTENISRAYAEASAISNVQTIDDWHHDLEDSGFINIQINPMKSKLKWFPEPFKVLAQKKSQMEEK